MCGVDCDFEGWALSRVLEGEEENELVVIGHDDELSWLSPCLALLSRDLARLKTLQV
jgi:hypothetical protein